MLLPAIREQPTQDSRPVRFVSQDGRYLIETPSGWQEDRLLLDLGGGHALITASDFGRDLHLAVTAVSKSDLVEPDLQAYAANGVIAFSESVENPETIPWKAMNINGLPALQCTARGEFNDVRSVFLMTYVDTGDCFCTIGACATPSEFEKYRMELETITSTFRQVEGGNQ